MQLCSKVQYKSKCSTYTQHAQGHTVPSRNVTLLAISLTGKSSWKILSVLQPVLGDTPRVQHDLLSSLFSVNRRSFFMLLQAAKMHSVHRSLHSLSRQDAT